MGFRAEDTGDSIFHKFLQCEVYRDKNSTTFNLQMIAILHAYIGLYVKIGYRFRMKKEEDF